eukprot:768369-Hanusia_phi.AAC.1
MLRAGSRRREPMRAWQAVTPPRDSRNIGQEEMQEERATSEQQASANKYIEVVVADSPHDRDRHDVSYEYIDPRRLQSPTRRPMGNMERRHYHENQHLLPSDGGLAGDMGDKFCDVWDSSNTPLKARRRSGKRPDRMNEIFSDQSNMQGYGRYHGERANSTHVHREVERNSSPQKDRDRSGIQHSIKNDDKANPNVSADIENSAQPPRNKSERLKSILKIQDSTCSGSVDWHDFRYALQEAGIHLNARDTSSVWLKSGGSVDGSGGPLGKISIDTIMREVSESSDRRSEVSSREMSQNEARRYSAHMQSNLTTGMQVNTAASEFECTGGGMRKGRQPISYAWQHGSLNNGMRDRQFLEKQHVTNEYDAMARWTKNESKLKDDLVLKRNQIKRLFSTETEEQKSLGFEEFRTGMMKVGIIVSDHDCERIWRRIDKECLGQVNFDQVVSAFDLTEKKMSTSTSLPTQNHGKDINSPVILRKVKDEHDPNKLSTDKISLSIVTDAPKGSILKTLQKSLDKNRISQRDFSDALASAGLVVNQTDCNELYKRAGGGIMKPYVTMGDIEQAILSSTAVQEPGADQAIFCFSSKEGLYPRESQPSRQESAQDAQLMQACHKLTSGCLKNPHRLVQVQDMYFHALVATHLPCSCRSSASSTLTGWVSLAGWSSSGASCPTEYLYPLATFRGFRWYTQAASIALLMCGCCAGSGEQERDGRLRRFRLESLRSAAADGATRSAGTTASLTSADPYSHSTVSLTVELSASVAHEVPRSSQPSSTVLSPLLLPISYLSLLQVHNERSRASIRSERSTTSVNSSFGGRDNTSRSSWMNDTSVNHGQRGPVRARSASPARPCRVAVQFEDMGGAAPVPAPVRSSLVGPSSCKILHLAAAPPVAIHRPRAAAN